MSDLDELARAATSTPKSRALSATAPSSSYTAVPPAAKAKSKKTLIIGISAAVVLLLLLAGYFMFSGGNDDGQSGTAPTAEQEGPHAPPANHNSKMFQF